MSVESVSNKDPKKQEGLEKQTQKTNNLFLRSYRSLSRIMVRGNSSGRNNGSEAVRVPPGRRPHRDTVPAPANKDSSIVTILSAILGSILPLYFYGILSIPFWMLTLLLSPLYGRPPTLVYVSQVYRYIMYVVYFNSNSNSNNNDKVLLLSQQIILLRTILLHTLKSGWWGYAWILDEILYGTAFALKNNNSQHQQQRYAATHPVFIVSGFRSASTTLGRDLVQWTTTSTTASATTTNTNSSLFVTPNAMMMAYPYLWLWKLVYTIFGDIPDGNQDDDEEEEEEGIITKQYIRDKLNMGFRSYHPDSLDRHPNDPFLLDTFDQTFLAYHCNGLIWKFLVQNNTNNATVITKEFNYAVQDPNDAINQQIYQVDMVNHIDRLARKTVLFLMTNTNKTEQQPRRRRFLLKGHFLSICPQLENRYTNNNAKNAELTRGGERHNGGGVAQFVTIIRDPSDRLQSGINYMAVNPTLDYLNTNNNNNNNDNNDDVVPWYYYELGLVLERMERQYCAIEMDYFGKNTDDNNERAMKLAIPFDSFVTKKDQTLAFINNWLKLPQPPRQLDDSNTTLSSSSSSSRYNNKKKKKRNQRQNTYNGSTATNNNNIPNNSNANSQKKKHRYQINRSLSDCDIDDNVYRDQLKEYIAWMKKLQQQQRRFHNDKKME